MSRRTLFFGCTMGAVVLAGPAGVARGQGAVPARASAAPAGAGTNTQAEPAGRPLSLSRAVELFRRQNLRLVAGRHQVSAARADAVVAGLIANPSLSFGAQFLTHGA